MAAVPLPKDVFDKAVKSALGKVNTRGISALTQHQSKALLNFLCGKETFVCLPTGHGKTLIYQLCPVVVKELSSLGLKQFPSDPVIVVISPLNSLIEDQIWSGFIKLDTLHFFKRTFFTYLPCFPCKNLVGKYSCAKINS